ncbi:MAG: right-handed parallel beta-helix repeat-containing protein [Nanoarchaeota archaeon]|nr:right-handed parallel beta-helix repeat-containing protein [Nanoarchaeota archaeon]
MKRGLLIGMGALLFVGILLILINFVSAEDYYVSLQGDNANPGTIQQPWETIQYAADFVSVGDKVIVLEGDYRNQGRTYLRKSGDENAKIIFEGQGKVITKGFGVFTLQGGPVNYIIIKGFEITDTIEDVINGPGVIVYGRGNEIKDNKIYGVFSQGIWLFAQYDGVENPDLDLTSNCIIKNNVIENSGEDGIRIYGNNNKVEGNILKNNKGMGIASLNTGGNEILNNEIYGNDKQGIHLAHSEASVIERNVVYENCQNYDDCFGIDIIGIGDNNLVKYNEVYSQHDTISDENVALRYGDSKFGTGGVRFDGDYNGDLATSTQSLGNKIFMNIIQDEYQGIQIINYWNSEIYNNVIYNSGIYGVLVMAQPAGGVTKNTKLKNNIVLNAEGFLVYNFGAEENEFDYNVYFNSEENFNSNGEIGNFEFWKLKGNDLNSNFGNPLFIDDNFHVNAESIVIDSGVDVGIEKDFEGNLIPQGILPDVGIYESEGFAQEVCGNGIIEEGEECEVDNLNGKSCKDFGFDFGELLCVDCVFDFSGCGTGCNEAECSQNVFKRWWKTWIYSCRDDGRCCVDYWKRGWKTKCLG